MPIETMAKSKKARRRLVKQSYGKRSSTPTGRRGGSRAQAEKIMLSTPPLRARRKHAAQKQQLLANFSRSAPKSKKGTLERLIEDGVVGLVSPKTSKSVRRAWYGTEDPSVTQVGLQISPAAAGLAAKSLGAASRMPKHIRTILGARRKGRAPAKAERGPILKDLGWAYLGAAQLGALTKGTEKWREKKTKEWRAKSKSKRSKPPWE